MAEDRKAQSADKYILRFPDGMRDLIALAADASGRSINAELVERLRATFHQGQLNRLLALAVVQETLPSVLSDKFSEQDLRALKASQDVDFKSKAQKVLEASPSLEDLKKFSSGGDVTGARDDSLRALSLRLAETELESHVLRIESDSHLLDAHFAAGCALDAVAFNKHLGYEQPIEDVDLKEVQTIYANAQDILDDQPADTLDKILKQIEEARSRLAALRPQRSGRIRKPRSGKGLK